MVFSMASRQRFGVDPVELDLSIEAPLCPHGPTLMFERFYARKEPRKFFACGVHRDRKGCPFFHWADEKISEEKRLRWMSEFKRSQPNLDRTSLLSRLEAFQRLSAEERSYCHTCETLVMGKKEMKEHGGHQLCVSVTDEQLACPSKLMSPLGDRKAQAQFYFSEDTLEFLCSEIKRLGCVSVLCVGVPRLHETLFNKGATNSMLLDIDHRYAQFYGPTHYQRYNMFNGYFYEEAGKEECVRFIQSALSKDSGKTRNPILVIMDPPFGGLASLIAKSLKKLWSFGSDEELPTCLVFPYYLEAHVKDALPSFAMMDYQVTYCNHKNFSQEMSKKKSKPSPVRIFTNLPLPGLNLPTEEGYRLCSKCCRYVAPFNLHCEKCDACTSKDGRQYSHCDACGVCVKPGRDHCLVCKSCELPDHTCGTKKGSQCHICGADGHKRRDCPQRMEPQTRKSNAKRRRKTKTSKLLKTKRHKMDSD